MKIWASNSGAGQSRRRAYKGREFFLRNYIVIKRRNIKDASRGSSILERFRARPQCLRDGRRAAGDWRATPMQQLEPTMNVGNNGTFRLQFLPSKECRFLIAVLYCDNDYLWIYIPRGL